MFDPLQGRYAVEMHPEHPDERYMHGGLYRLPAPGYWLIASGLLGAVGVCGLAWLAGRLYGAGLEHALLALTATLAAACGLVAMRQHRLSLGERVSNGNEETLLPQRLSISQLLFIVICIAAMTMLLMLTAPARVALTVPLASLAFLLLAGLLAMAIAGALYGTRWRLARAAGAKRHAEPDLGYFGIWDRI